MSQHHRIYHEIYVDVADPVATITLNRPHTLNAWTPLMEAELRHAVGVLERDPAVVGIVLTGAGRGFCAGADMKVLDDLAADPTDTRQNGGAEPEPIPGSPTWSEDLRGEYTYLLSVPKPIVAAINGAVAGLALPIVLACDVRLMNEDAVITTSFVQRGLIAEWGLSWLLTRLVGPAHALDLLYTGRRVNGTEAARIGLVNVALPAGEVLAAAQDYIRALAVRSSPTSMAVMKRQVYTELHAGLRAAEEQAAVYMAESFERPDFAEGLQAYAERRDPRFARLPAADPHHERLDAEGGAAS